MHMGIEHGRGHDLPVGIHLPHPFRRLQILAHRLDDPILHQDIPPHRGSFLPCDLSTLDKQTHAPLLVFIRGSLLPNRSEA